MVDARDRLDGLPAEQRAELLRKLRAARAGRDTVPALGRDAPLPLSFAQQRLFFLDLLAPGRPLYNIPYALRLRGRLRPDLLAGALGRVLARHEVLRTRFVTTPDGPRQVVDPAPERVELAVRDLGVVPAADRAGRARELAVELAAEPFDLAAGPLFRAGLARLGPDDHVLVLAVHHIATDSWSTGLLVAELAECTAAAAQGREPVLPALPVQYADWAAWQQGRLSGAGLEADLAYWREQLAGLPTLDMPTDRPRPAEPTWAGAVTGRRLDAALHRDVLALAERCGTRLLPVLVAAFTAVLARSTGQVDIPVGSVFSGRTRSETEPLLGFFATTVVLRTSAAGDPTFRELLDRATHTVLDAHAHQELPFDALVDALKPARDPGRNPLFQVALYLADSSGDDVDLGDVAVEPLPITLGTARFDCTVTATASRGGGLDLEVEYATELFDDDRMVRLLGQLETVLRQVVADPDVRLGDLSLLTPVEAAELDGWAAPAGPLTGPDRIEAAIAAQIARTPDAPAVVHGGITLTYAELDGAADRLARRLRAAGAGPDRLVGVCVERSAGMLVALLAVLRTGAAYVPMDPAYPAARLTLMLTDAAPVAVILDEVGRAAALDLPPGTTPVDITDTPTGPAPGTPAADAPGSPAGSGGEGATGGPLPTHGAAYVIFTSGSTGRPKGVVVEHAQAVAFFAAMDAELGVRPGDPAGTWLAVTSISFDISVLELLWTLSRGFRVVIAGGGAADLVPTAAPARDAAFSLFYFASDDEREGDRYRVLIEGAKFADTHGFEAVWLPERHFHSFGGLYPSPAVLASALAMITERVGLRAGSVVLPLHHPVRVAEEWSVIDNLSGGRVGLSAASGWHADDFVLAPANHADRRTLMLEQLETVRALWRGEAVTLPGGTGAPVDVRIRPRPVQPELPVWLTAAGNPETFTAAGRSGAHLLTHLLGQDLGQLAEKIAAYRRAWAETHGGPGGHVTLMVHTFLGADRDAVLATVRGPFLDYLRGSLDLVRALARRMGMDVAAGTVSADDVDAVLERAYDRYVQESGLFGVPEDCLDLVGRLTAAGVDELACLVDFGVAPDEVLASLPHLDRLRRLVAAPPAGDSLPELADRHDVTHLQCTPALARLLVDSPAGRAALARLDTLLVGGEALPADLARRLAEAVGGRVLNMYGPTETTVWSTVHPVTGAEEGAVAPIGRPTANTVVRVLDRWGRPVPVGVTGELLIGGAAVTRGYHHRPALTAERFVPDGPGRAYRTGDLVRWRADGSLLFLGRDDGQVKVRGFRVELGEVEAALRAVPGIAAAAVAAHGRPGEQRLVGYLVGESTPPGPGELRERLRRQLPEHMVPTLWVPLDALPLTPNGKLDRAALPAPGDTRPAAPAVAPRTPAERALAEVWAEVLELPEVGVTANFFDLGGNSILAIRAVDLANRRGLGVSVRQLFQHQSVAGLAAVAGSGGGTEPRRAGAALRRLGGTDDTLAPVFFVHGSGGSALSYVPLAQQLGDRPAWGIEAAGLAGDPPVTSVGAMAERYAELVRGAAPAGPVHLVGWSTGGGLAVALAQRLRDAGTEVGLLALLDAMSPPRLDRAPDEAEVLGLFAADFAASLGADLPVPDLRAVPPPARLDAVLDRLDRAGLLRGARAEVAARAAVFRATVAAGAVWRPGTYGGAAELVLAGSGGGPTGSGDDPAQQWRSVITGPVRVHRTAGDHYSMMRTEHAPGLGRLVQHLIDNVSSQVTAMPVEQRR